MHDGSERDKVSAVAPVSGIISKNFINSGNYLTDRSLEPKVRFFFVTRNLLGINKLVALGMIDISTFTYWSLTQVCTPHFCDR